MTAEPQRKGLFLPKRQDKRTGLVARLKAAFGKKGSGAAEKKFILCLDGGGTKTLAEAIILKRVERIIREFDGCGTLQTAFDMFAGTSAGGLGAMMLAGRPNTGSDDLKKMTVLKNAEIFTPEKKPFYKLISNKYSQKGLEKTLSDMFKDAKIADAPVPFLVMAFDTISLKPVMISNSNEFCDLTFVQAGLATAAAPTYFNPVKISHMGTEMNLVDGGIAANNPSLFAIKLARQVFGENSETHILSLGSYKNPERFENTEGAFPWIDITKGYGLPIQKAYHAANEETANQIASSLQSVRYLRIENERGEFKDSFRVDSTLEHDMLRIMEIAEQIADKCEGKIRSFIKERYI